MMRAGFIFNISGMIVIMGVLMPVAAGQ